jgi:23S rRNA (adenine2503-C2)-methyltransferase
VKGSLLEFDIDDLPMPAGESYRRKQLAKWLYAQGARSFNDMSNLPAGWRERLAQSYSVSVMAGYERFASKDGAVKYLFTLHDGKRTEAVYMPYHDRKTLCISSMVGCPAACAFCATGAMGFGRNLSRGEILDQIITVAGAEGIAPKEIRNVVLMGMGEALLNYDNALGAIRTMVHPEGLDMSPRRITLSTVGLPERIRRLANEGLALVLAVSLHAPDEATRRKIIPTAHAHSIDDIVASLRDWVEATGRRVTVEYTMLRGVNDALWQAEMLAERLAGLISHVNLIPFNPWESAPFEGSQKRKILAFQEALAGQGLSVSVRFSRGRDAGAACGQLALTRPAAAPQSARAL